MTGAVVVGRQNRLMRAFEDAGALTPDAATTLEALGQRGGFVFRRMVARGVFVETGDGRWWMDGSAAAEFVHRRHRIVLVLLAIMAVVALLAALEQAG